MTITNKSNRYVDIKGYDLEQGKFDGMNGHTYTFEEVSDFILSSKELQEIIDKLKAKPVVAEQVTKSTDNIQKGKKVFTPKVNKVEEE